jgi:hypothetical protein
MSHPMEWSDDQKEALKRWSDKDKSERHPHDLLPSDEEEKKKPRQSLVTAEECADMRSFFKTNNTNIKQMAEHHFEYSRTTIAEHVFNRRCSHDIDEEPVESPSDDVNPANYTKADECAEMREMYQEVRSIPVIQEEFDKTYAQAYHHLAGRCKCKHNTPNIHAIE